MQQQKRYSEILSLEEKIGQMLVVGFHGLKPPKYILEWLAQGLIGGVILFSRNIDNPRQVSELTKACHEAASYPILVAIDQEGGVVARLRKSFTESPGAMILGAADSEKLAEDVSAVLGIEMRALGINWNLAPVLDITHNIHNPSVGVRSLGTDPERVSKLGVAQIRGFQKVGVAATAKHFPGKANTPVDPHVQLPVIEGQLNQMWENDLIPFRAASDEGIAAMMITHVQFKDLEPDYPSTLSPKIIQWLLRKKIGFTGVVTTDCMEMKAITNNYGPGESAVLAAMAGANIILFSHTKEYQKIAYKSLLEAAISNRLSLNLIDTTINKIQSIKERFNMLERPSLAVIRNPNHMEITLKTARAGTVLLKRDSEMLPLRSDHSRFYYLYEFVSHSGTENQKQDNTTLFATLLNEKLINFKNICLDSNDPTDKSLAYNHETIADKIVIVATRNAHLNPKQLKKAKELINSTERSVLICLRNPYDAGILTEAKTVLCTCGDSIPSIKAAIEALTGQFTPTAKLPAPLTMK